MAARFPTLLVVALLLGSASPAAATEPDRNPHFPMAAAEAERRLAREDFAILRAKRTAQGLAGARKLRLRFTADGGELDVKWKAAPARTADGFNNTPRKEVAAYAVQKWFLAPKDYVVPPTETRCIALDAYAPVDPAAAATLPGTRCVFGALSLWLQQVRRMTRVWDEARYEADPHYALAIGHANLLGYLIQHRDGRRANFLASADGVTPARVFMIDNGIAFGARVWNFFVRNPSRLRVPELPRTAIARLRTLHFEDVAALGVLGELGLDERGVLRHRDPGPNLDPERGVRIRDDVLQYGLSRDEIEELWERIVDLLEEVDDGDVGLR